MRIHRLFHMLMGEESIRNECIEEVQKYAVQQQFLKTPYFLGRCNICGKFTAFFWDIKTHPRESLSCPECLSTSRYRSIARGTLNAINELVGIKGNSLAELANSSSSFKIKVYDTQVPFTYKELAYTIPKWLELCGWIEVYNSQYQPDHAWGTALGQNITNQNLENLTFPDNMFDIVITSDVMEHVRLDDLAHSEIRRVLKPGGFYIFTVPHTRSQNESCIYVEVKNAKYPSKDKFLKEPEYHGDSNSPNGSLSYRAYGKELDDALAKLGFTVDYTIEDFPEQGIINTELFYCRLAK